MVIILQMDGKLEWEQLTMPNSPSRLHNDTLSLNLESNVKSMAVSQKVAPGLSATETQIYSHDLIREVMEQSHARSIHHQVNHIDSQTPLYAKPKGPLFDQSHFECIPPTEQLYASTYHSHIKDLQEKINQEHTCNRSRKARPSSSSVRTSISTKNPHVSVSAVVSHNFSRVQPKNSLGLRRINHQANLQEEDRDSFLRTTCAPRRHSKILERTSKRRSEMKNRSDSVITGEFSSDTGKFLGGLLRTKESNGMIYGEKAKNLCYVKDLMQFEGTSFEEASFVVGEVTRAKATREAVTAGSRRVEKTNEKAHSEQDQLNRRRVPPRTSRVVVRQFYFME